MITEKFISFEEELPKKPKMRIDLLIYEGKIPILELLLEKSKRGHG